MAPTYTHTSPQAVKVRAGMTTSSPAPIPKPSSARCSAAVHRQRVPHADPLGDGRLERVGLRPGRQPAGAQHLDDSLGLALTDGGAVEWDRLRGLGRHVARWLGALGAVGQRYEQYRVAPRVRAAPR